MPVSPPCWTSKGGLFTSCVGFPLSGYSPPAVTYRCVWSLLAEVGTLSAGKSSCSMSSSCRSIGAFHASHFLASSATACSFFSLASCPTRLSSPMQWPYSSACSILVVAYSSPACASQLFSSLLQHLSHDLCFVLHLSDCLLEVASLRVRCIRCSCSALICRTQLTNLLR